MFGSLVVAFPTEHEGGELVLRPRNMDTEVCLDFSQWLGAKEEPHVAYACFFGDVEHEVYEVTKGSFILSFLLSRFSMLISIPLQAIASPSLITSITPIKMLEFLSLPRPSSPSSKTPSSRDFRLSSMTLLSFRMVVPSVSVSGTNTRSTSVQTLRQSLPSLTS